MKFKNPEYQKKHDEIAEKYKKLTGKDFDESFEGWKSEGMPKYEPSEKFKKEFEEWKNDPRRDEKERNAKMMLESLKEIHANLGKNMAEQELRKKKRSTKLKRKCRCKK